MCHMRETDHKHGGDRDKGEPTTGGGCRFGIMSKSTRSILRA